MFGDKVHGERARVLFQNGLFSVLLVEVRLGVHLEQVVESWVTDIVTETSEEQGSHVGFGQILRSLHILEHMVENRSDISGVVEGVVESGEISTIDINDKVEQLILRDA